MIKAFELTKYAASQGYAKAQFILGLCYANGTGVRQNNKEAVYWYRKSANQGYANAQNNLGNCYKYGNGCENPWSWRWTYF